MSGGRRHAPKLKNRVNANLWTWAHEHKITMKTLARRSGVNRGYLVRARRRGQDWPLGKLYMVYTAMGEPADEVFSFGGDKR